jgi:hypothetical protein
MLTSHRLVCRPGCSWRGRQSLSPASDIRGRLVPGRTRLRLTATRPTYGAGGWLVGHLLQTTDPALFVQFCSSIAHDADATTFGQTFASIYGMSLDDVWDETISSTNAPMFCPWDCSQPAFSFGGPAEALTPACGAGSEQLTFSLDQAVATQWTITGDAGLFIRSCEGLDEPTASFSGHAGEAGVLAALSAGRYFIDAQVEVGASSTLVGGPALGAFFSPTCATAPAVPSDLLSLASLSLFYPSSSSGEFTSLGAGVPPRGSLLLISEGTASAELCSSCDQTLCSSVSSGGVATANGITAGWTLDVAPGDSVTATLSWF